MRKKKVLSEEVWIAEDFDDEEQLEEQFEKQQAGEAVSDDGVDGSEGSALSDIDEGGDDEVD